MHPLERLEHQAVAFNAQLGHVVDPWQARGLELEQVLEPSTDSLILGLEGIQHSVGGETLGPKLVEGVLDHEKGAKASITGQGSHRAVNGPQMCTEC